MSASERRYEPTRLFPATATEPMLARIAVLLGEKGVDPASAILADYFQDDSSLMFGLVVSMDGRVFRFDYDFLNKPGDAGELSEWVELTDAWRDGIYATPIALAFKELERSAT